MDRSYPYISSYFIIALLSLNLYDVLHHTLLSELLKNSVNILHKMRLH